MNEKDISFYLDNQEKVNQLVNFKQEYKRHIIAEVDRAGECIEGVKLMMPRNSFNTNRLRYYQSTRYSELIYTIVFEDLFNEKNLLHIIIEPRGKTLRDGDVFKTIEFEKNERSILQNDFYSKTHEGWAHFAARSYDMKKAHITNLSDFIQKRIANDAFQSVFCKMARFLLEKNSLHNRHNY